MRGFGRLFALVLALGGAGTAAAGPETSARSETVYHVFVRSFADSDGDRNGDLKGIRSKLDYLQSLGVTTLLLTPLYPSKFYHNYFADDFEGIDAEFGSPQDFSALVHDLRARGMKIYLDQEIQYVSGRHPWRIKSRDDPHGPFGRFLLYSDAENRRPVATLFGTNDFYVWPDQRQQIFTVNLNEPKVRDYFVRYLKAWVDPNGDGDPRDGVDGFRIDHMMDDLDNAGVLTGLFDGFWQPVFEELRALNPDIRIIAEQADWGDGEAFFTRGRVDTVFAFPIWRAATKLDASAYAAAIERSNAVVTGGRDQFVFIENHDTERFAEGPRRRPEVLKLGAAVVMLTGWTPSLYYGQEIGMSGTHTNDYAAKGDKPANADARDIPLRQAFRWVADPTAPGIAAWYRLYPEAYHTPDSNAPGDGASVSEQDKDARSLLNTYRKLAALRAEHSALAEGSTRVVAQQGSTVLIERRTKAETAMVLFNFGEAPLSVVAALPAGATRRYGEAQATREGDGVRIAAPAYSATVWTSTP